MNRRSFLKWLGLGAVETAIPGPLKAFVGRKAHRIDPTKPFTVQMKVRVRTYMVGVIYKPFP